MEQCKVNNNDCTIIDIDDIYGYIRKYMGNDFASIAETMIGDKILRLESCIDDAHAELNECDERIAELEDSLEYAENTIDELQDKLLKNE
jgi:hypothetical protein